MIICMHPANVPEDDNQFIRLLVDSLIKEGAKVIPFSWKTVLFQRFDILHVHWPEYLLPMKKNFSFFIKFMIIVLLNIKLRINKIPILLTVHNLEPHERPTQVHRFFNKYFIDRISNKVYMQKDFESTTSNFFVSHGNYIELFNQEEVVAMESMSFTGISFGYLRPYKNLENLIRNFPVNLGTLAILGKPITSDYGIYLQDCLTRSRNEMKINLVFKQLAEVELLRIIVSSEIAIFPYKKIYNSGAVLLALSAPIPVIVTDSMSMRDLQVEVGSEWLQIIPDDFDAKDLECAVEKLRSQQSIRSKISPLSESRKWDTIARKYMEIYTELDAQL